MPSHTRTKRGATRSQEAPDARADAADGESAVLAAIAALPEPYRTMGKLARVQRQGQSRRRRPMAGSLTELTAAEEARFGALAMKAVS